MYYFILAESFNYHVHSEDLQISTVCLFQVFCCCCCIRGMTENEIVG